MRSSITIYAAALAALLVASTLAQGPGDGVAKATYASSDPTTGLAWMLKYLPTTAAEDSCYSNYCPPNQPPDGEKWQGRAQLVQPFTGMIVRNCQLWSKFSTYKQQQGAVNVVAATSKGYDCSYYSGYAFDATTAVPLHATFAHNQDTCCKACAATKGCTGATYTPETNNGGRRLLQPMPGEGFGLHLVDVMSSSTSGGLTIAELEDKYTARLGDLSSFDAFLDYSVQLFTANLPAYATAFAKDNVPHLVASWPAGSGSTWYSIFVRVPGSQMILEIQGKDHPDGSSTLGGSAVVPLESRMSPRNVALYSKYVKDKNNLLYAAGVSRATSNITRVEDFYLNVLKATSTQSVDVQGVSRRCFKWSTA